MLSPFNNANRSRSMEQSARLQSENDAIAAYDARASHDAWSSLVRYQCQLPGRIRPDHSIRSETVRASNSDSRGHRIGDAQCDSFGAASGDLELNLAIESDAREMTRSTNHAFCFFRNIFKSFSRNLLAKNEFNGYIICHEIKTQLLEECSSDVGFRVRNFHQRYCARSVPVWYLRSNHHFPPGHIIVDRAPNFGWNLAFNLLIDGQVCGERRTGSQL